MLIFKSLAIETQVARVTSETKVNFHPKRDARNFKFILVSLHVS